MVYRMRGVLRRARGFGQQRLILAAIGLFLGLILIWLPLPWIAGLIIASIACGVAVLQPAFGLALALVFGPGKALAWEALALIPVDPGQILIALTFAGWALRRLAERHILVPLSPITAPLLVYVGVGAISLWGAVDPIEGLMELFKWLQVVAVAVIVLDVSRHGQLTWIVAAALLSGVLQAGIGLWQFELRGTGPAAFEVADGRYRAYGTFEQPNPFGGFMGLVWPLSFAVAIANLRRTPFGELRSGLTPVIHKHFITSSVVGVTVITGLALFASYSRGAWIGSLAAAAIMLTFWPRRRWQGITLAAVILTILMFLSGVGWLPQGAVERLASITEFAKASDMRGVEITTSHFSVIERIAHWQAAVSMAKAHPWLGVGLGNFEVAYQDFRLVNWQYGLGHAHNIYLNVAAETGMIGLAAYLYFWSVVFILTLRTLATNQVWERTLAFGLLGVWTHLCVHNLVDNLFVNNVHLYIGALLGLLSVLLERTGVARRTFQRKAEDHARLQDKGMRVNRVMVVDKVQRSV